MRILGSCGLAAIALGLPMQGAAQTALQVKEQRALSYPRAIGRAEVDREGVLSITAPSSRSLRLTAIGEGAATVSVYGGDGGLMAREPVSVTPGAAASAPIVRAGEQVVAVDVQFAAVSATTLKALGFKKGAAIPAQGSKEVDFDGYLRVHLTALDAAGNEVKCSAVLHTRDFILEDPSGFDAPPTYIIT